MSEKLACTNQYHGNSSQRIALVGNQHFNEVLRPRRQPFAEAGIPGISFAECNMATTPRISRNFHIAPGQPGSTSHRLRAHTPGVIKQFFKVL